MLGMDSVTSDVNGTWKLGFNGVEFVIQSSKLFVGSKRYP